MRFQLRKANDSDIQRIDELCKLSWENQNQWLAYPRVEDYKELIAEIKEYSNTLEESIYLVENLGKVIGFTGFLFEPGDEEAFIIGPVFQEGEHTTKNVRDLIEQISNLGKEKFHKLSLSSASDNIFTNEALNLLNWKLTHEETEMKYHVPNVDSVDFLHKIKRLNKNNETIMKSVSSLYEEVFHWEKAEERLRHYLGDFGMEAAYIENEDGFLGAILWDHIEGTDFYRLEDVAVTSNARGKGVGRDLIHFVLNEAKAAGVSSVFLSVQNSNIRAQKLYSSVGFLKTIQTKTYSVTF